MKTYKELMESLTEAWPGTPEWNAKYGKKPSTDRHDIIRGNGVTKAIRKYDPKTGESEEPEAHKVAGEQPVKRGRGRPPGKYGSYKGYNRTGKYVGVHAARKQKTQEAFDYLMTLESEEEIKEFMSTLEEDIFADLHEYLVELEELESEDILAEEEIIAEEKHRVLVTVSEPDHPLVSARKEKRQKFIRVSAADKDTAIKKAKDYYRKQNYRVHDAEHVGMVNEEAEQIDEMQQGKEYSRDAIMKKIQTGNWEATQDIKPGKHVELRHRTGKRVTVMVKPVKEEAEYIEEMQQGKEYSKEKHRVLVTVSDPHHPMVSMRNTQKQKFIRVTAADKNAAVQKARDYYEKQNYKVHDAVHVGMVKEEAEYIEEMKYGKEYSKEHIEKKIRSGDWEAVTDIKPGNHVELRHHTGKRVTVFVKPAPVKEEVEHLDESVKSYASFITRQQ